MPGPTHDDVIVFKKVFVMYDKNVEMGKEEFEDLFSEFGAIEQVHINTEIDSGAPKGVCYITFSKTSEACRAAEEMNDKNLPGHGKKLRVHIAYDRRGTLEIDVEAEKMLQRLFVNHPKSASQEEVKEFFSQFGEVIWMYMLKDKNSGIPRGSAFIKYEHQSQAALALEECNASAAENNYRARWADVRKADPNAPPRRHGVSLEMTSGGRQDRDRGMGRREDADMMNYPSTSGGGGFPNNPSVIEALVPKALNKEQIYRLFDIAPGLQDISQDDMTGMVTCHYSTPSNSLYAKEKLDGLELYGEMIAIRFRKNAGRGAGGMGGGAGQMRGMQGEDNVHALVQSLHQITETIAHTGMSGGGGDIYNYEPVSSVRLPNVKKLQPADAPVAAQVFISTMPPPGQRKMPEEVLMNVCCRFGSLIGVRWVQGKMFGFASYSNKSSATAAVNKLNGATIDENQLKVEMAKGRDDDGPHPQKRARQS